MKKIILTFYLLTMLTACSNTWEGVKQDSKSIGQSVGEVMEDVSEKLKEASE